MNKIFLNIISRFAPSPTGFIHIGNIKSILNLYYFLIYKYNNKYYLYIRIDDTNFKKYNIFYLKYLLNIIFYFKIYYNNIIFQSNKYYRYIEVTQYLLKKKLIFISYEDFFFNKFSNIYKKLNIKFILFNKNLLKKKILFVIKIFFFKLNINFKFFEHYFIIIKSNGIPIYNYSTVIDDVDMNINLIFRGIDHLNNLYKQIFFYFILKKKIPIIFHKEILLNNLGNKICKSKNSNLLKIKNIFFLESLILYIFNLLYIDSFKKILKNINYINSVFFLKINFLNLNYINKKIIKILNIFYLKSLFKLYIYKKFFFKKKFFYKFNFNFILNNFFKKFFSQIIDSKYLIIFNKNNFINIIFLKKINRINIKNFFHFLIKKKKKIFENNFYFFLKLYFLNKKIFPYIILYLKNFNNFNIFKKIKINFLSIKYIVPFV